MKKSFLKDFSSNVNAFGLPPAVTRAIAGSIRDITGYPDRRCSGLLNVLSGHLGISESHIAAGNGSADILYRLVPSLNIRAAVVVMPSFGEYAKALEESGARVIPFFVKERYGFIPEAKEIMSNLSPEADAVFLCNPNNPTGSLMSKREAEFLAGALCRRKRVLILDEAFMDFSEESSLAAVAAKSSNLIVLRSMTKFFGLAGLRLGYAVGSQGIIRRLRDFGQPWPVNILAQEAGRAVLKEKKFFALSREKLINERNFLYERLAGMKGIRPFQSAGNFIMVKIENGFSSGQLQMKLAKRGLLIRDCADFAGLNNKFFRVAVRGRVDNLRLIRNLKIVLKRR